MKAVVQRVIDASVSAEGVIKGKIKNGLLIYLGVAAEDTEADADWLAGKTTRLRIFNDGRNKMNISLNDMISGENGAAGALVISQFTLLADTRKGGRPSWNGAAPAEKAKKLYDYFIMRIRDRGIVCESGEFQAHMSVNYTNDGPVTIILDTKERR
jgi:D-tyrosyl-tRNA(Tyr) deacylase